MIKKCYNSWVNPALKSREFSSFLKYPKRCFRVWSYLLLIFLLVGGFFLTRPVFAKEHLPQVGKQYVLSGFWGVEYSRDTLGNGFMGQQSRGGGLTGFVHPRLAWEMEILSITRGQGTSVIGVKNRKNFYSCHLLFFFPLAQGGAFIKTGPTALANYSEIEVMGKKEKASQLLLGLSSAIGYRVLMDNILEIPAEFRLQLGGVVLKERYFLGCRLAAGYRF